MSWRAVRVYLAMVAGARLAAPQLAFEASQVGGEV
jgi:hypothetical protein